MVGPLATSGRWDHTIMNMKGPLGPERWIAPFFNGWTWNQTQQFGSNGLELDKYRGNFYF